MSAVSRLLTVPPLTSCRDCGAPAEITDRYVLEGTDCPVEHIRTWCSGTPRHILIVAAH